MTQQKTTKDTTTSPLAESVLERISNEQVVPCSKWQVRCSEYSVWLLWGTTVAFGALSVAVMLFVGGHASYALHEATHTSVVSFFVEVMPYIWIGVFGVMALLAYVNFRHTKHGYRYQVHHILLSSIAFSVLGGLFLHAFNVGAIIDDQFGKRMATYPSMEKKELQLWQDAAAGRLVGTFMEMDETDSLYMFTDTAGARWHIETVELRDRDRQLLSSGNTVRVLGTTTDAVAAKFYACGVFPWMFDKKTSLSEMREDRKEFVDKMYEHMESGQRTAALERETYDNPAKKPFADGKCAELAAVKRMRF